MFSLWNDGCDNLIARAGNPEHFFEDQSARRCEPLPRQTKMARGRKSENELSAAGMRGNRRNVLGASPLCCGPFSLLSFEFTSHPTISYCGTIILLTGWIFMTLGDFESRNSVFHILIFIFRFILFCRRNGCDLIE